MKKLLLLPLMCCTQFTQPITLKNALGYTSLAGGIGGFAYTSNKKRAVDKNITAIRTQLRNPQLPPTDRAQLVKELQKLLAISNRYNRIMTASLAACGIGYGLISTGNNPPPGPNNAAYMQHRQPAPRQHQAQNRNHVWYRPAPAPAEQLTPDQQVIQQLTQEQLNAIQQCQDVDDQELKIWNENNAQREQEQQQHTAQTRQAVQKWQESIQEGQATRNIEDAQIRHEATLQRLQNVQEKLAEGRASLQKRRGKNLADQERATARAPKIAAMEDLTEKQAAQTRLQNELARIQAAQVRLQNEENDLDTLAALAQDPNIQDRLQAMSTEKITALHTQLNDLEVEPEDPLQKCDACKTSTMTLNFVNLTCGHSYCLTCLENLVNNAIQAGAPTDLICPDLKCFIPGSKLRKPLEIEDIQAITNGNATAMGAIAEIKTREANNKDQHFKQCPTPNCAHAVVNEGNNIRTIQCRNCERRYCSQCLINHPSIITCEQATIVNRNRDDIRNARDTAETNRITRQCPKCHARIFRFDGCNYIRCDCSHQFCWECLRPWYNMLFEPIHGHWECNGTGVTVRMQH